MMERDGSMWGKPNLMLVSRMMVRQFEPTVIGLLEGKKFPGPCFYTVQDLMTRLEKGTMQLWLAFDDGEPPFIMLITEIQQYPAGKVLNFCLLAGKDVRRILPYVGVAEKWAMMEGAFMATVSTRPKLATILRRYGYRTPLTTIFKPLVQVH